jgi:hypothetical protein
VLKPGDLLVRNDDISGYSQYATVLVIAVNYGPSDRWSSGELTLLAPGPQILSLNCAGTNDYYTVVTP